jgi:hypothetical protein
VTDTSEDKRPKKPKGPIVKKIVDYTKQVAVDVDNMELLKY